MKNTLKRALALALAAAFVAGPVAHAQELLTEKQYTELKEKVDKAGGRGTIDELAALEAYEKAQLEKDEAYQAKKALIAKVNDSKYLLDAEKANIVARINAGTLYDVLEVEPAKVEKELANAKARFMAELDKTKEPVRKEIYESKLSEEVKNTLFSKLAKAETLKAVEAVEKEFKALVKGEISVPTPAEPGKTDKEPGKTDKEPGKTDKEPGKTDKEPGKTDKEPGKTDKEPGKTTKPVDTDKATTPAKTTETVKGGSPQTADAGIAMSVISFAVAGGAALLADKKKRK
ncbi:hypothetical protein [uncultured Helcococcus sp.]|uniref:hypothetical protein n=1 Tax=uncultured Helcococcus sp. TaxID=1072508 RepID=UPI0026171B46|nr:hypothetical protein [uncultured Helcococcus sp.]